MIESALLMLKSAFLFLIFKVIDKFVSDSLPDLSLGNIVLYAKGFLLIGILALTILYCNKRYTKLSEEDKRFFIIAIGLIVLKFATDQYRNQSALLKELPKLNKI